MNRRTVIARTACAIALGTFASTGIAQTGGPVTRIVFPFAAGGGGDALSRLMAEHLSAELGRSVIVENRTGADGRIGIGSVKAAAPDGNTLLITTGPTMWLMAMVHKAPGYDPFMDFEPVSQLTLFEFCIAVANTTGLKSLPELVAWIKANPDKATYGIPGMGTIPHFTGVSLAKALGVDMRRLPYRGGALAITDLIAGQIPIAVLTVADALQQHKAGTVRILGVTSQKRSPFVPDVPTLKEAGIDLTGEAWYGMWAPAHTPAATISVLNAAVQRTLAKPEVKAKLESFGLIGTGTSPADLTRIMREATEQWRPVIKDSGYTMEN